MAYPSRMLSYPGKIILLNSIAYDLDYDLIDLMVAPKNVIYADNYKPIVNSRHQYISIHLYMSNIQHFI